MPDKNYSVDDILREIRAKQQGEESPAPKPAAPAMSREEKELLSRALEHNRNHTYSREERAPVREPEPEGEYFPEVRLELPKEGPAPVPSLDQLWKEEDTAPLRRDRDKVSAGEQARPQERPGRSGSAAVPVWEEELPGGRKSGGTSSRKEEAAPASRRTREEKTESAMWEEEEPSVRSGAAARLPGGRSSRIDAASAARMITGNAGDEDFEEQVVRRAQKAAVDREGRPSSRAQEEIPREKERPRRRSRQEREEEEAAPRQARKQQPSEEGRRGKGPRISAQLQGMKTSLVIRLVVNLICALGTVYLTLAPQMDLPIPEFFLDKPNVYLWVGVGLVAFSALVSGNTVGGGMISLFCLRPNNDSYSSIGVFACLVQGSYMAMRPEMMEGYADNLYLPMAALLLLFNTIGKLILRGRVARSYRFIAQEGAKHTAAVIEDRDLARRLGAGLIEDEPEIAYFASSSGVSAFMDQAFSESKAEDVSKVIAPMTAVAALVMAAISYPFHHDVFTSACVFTGALCITAPIAGVISANLPLTLVNRRLDRWGATLCGYSTVEQFANVNGVVLRCSDLFPPQSVTLQGIKPFNRTPMDEVILDAASVLSHCDSTLTRIFEEMVSGPGILRDVESLTYEDGMGISAWVSGRRVLIGNRELMKAHGVAIPPREYEEQYGQGKQILYLSNSGQAAAMYILSYKGDKQMRRSLELLADRDIAVCVYSTDPNVTAERVSQVYGFPRELVKVIPAALHREVDRYLDPQAKPRASVVHTGSPASYVRAVAAARSCDGVLTVETALILLSVVVGFALVTFFAFTGSMAALTWVTIAAYQGFWALVQLLVALLKRS